MKKCFSKILFLCGNVEEHNCRLMVAVWMLFGFEENCLTFIYQTRPLFLFSYIDILLGGRLGALLRATFLWGALAICFFKGPIRTSVHSGFGTPEEGVNQLAALDPERQIKDQFSYSKMLISYSWCRIAPLTAHPRRS